jgi:hypothetical protein
VRSQGESFHGWCVGDHLCCVSYIWCRVDNSPPNHVAMLIFFTFFFLQVLIIKGKNQRIISCANWPHGAKINKECYCKNIVVTCLCLGFVFSLVDIMNCIWFFSGIYILLFFHFLFIYFLRTIITSHMDELVYNEHYIHILVCMHMHHQFALTIYAMQY